MSDQASGVVRVAANAPHGARCGEVRMAVGARGRPVRPEGDGESEVVASRRDLTGARERRRCRRCHEARLEERGDPRDGAMALAAVAREGRREGRPRMHRPDVGASVFLPVAGETLHRGRGPLVIAASLVALTAVCKGMHAGERKPRLPVDVDGLGHLPAGGRMALVAASRQATTMDVLMAAVARALDRLTAVALVASGHLMLPRQRETCRGVIEAAGATCVALTPSNRRVARAARDGIGDVLARSRSRRCRRRSRWRRRRGRGCRRRSRRRWWRRVGPGRRRKRERNDARDERVQKGRGGEANHLGPPPPSALSWGFAWHVRQSVDGKR